MVGKVNGLWGLDKFNHMVIAEFWFKVDIQEVFVSNHPLMHIVPIVDKMTMGDVISSCALWHETFESTIDGV